MASRNDAIERARRLRLMAFDIDGVMSDGSLFYSDAGIELKGFNTRDGLGLKLLQEAGIVTAIITGRRSPCVANRAADLGISHLFQGVGDKATVLAGLLAELGIDASEAGYMGDDIVDLKVMDMCGFSAAPGDGHELAQRHAALVTQKSGGRGAVREVCEFILDAQGLLEAAFAPWLPESPTAS